jgi:hypothetical protein
MKTQDIAKSLTGAGALVIAGTALYHASGMQAVVIALETAQVDPFLVKASQGAWLHFSWHLFVIAAVAAVAMWGRDKANRVAVLICGLVAASDVILLLAFAGFFAGVVLLGIGGALLITGSLLLRPPAVAAPSAQASAPPPKPAA